MHRAHIGHLRVLEFLGPHDGLESLTRWCPIHAGMYGLYLYGPSRFTTSWLRILRLGEQEIECYFEFEVPVVVRCRYEFVYDPLTPDEIEDYLIITNGTKASEKTRVFDRQAAFARAWSVPVCDDVRRVVFGFLTTP